MGFFSSDLFKTLATGLLTLGTGLILNNQAVQNAKGQANDTQKALDTQYQIALQNQRNIKLMQQAGQEAPPKEKSNLPLYIGLGVGGVLVLGIVIFAVTRK
jgi:hypothetical protein